MSFFNKKIKSFIPDELSADEVKLRKAKVFVTCTFLGLFFYFAFALENFVNDHAVNFWTCLLGFIVLMLALANFKKRADLNLHSNVVAMSLMVVMVPQIIGSGGIFSPDTVWLALVPIFPFWFANRSSKVFWTITPLSWIIFLFLFEAFTESNMRVRTEELDYAYYFSNFFFLTVIFLAAFAVDAHYEEHLMNRVRSRNTDLSHAIMKMTDNVRYAQRVQEVLLGSADRLRESFEEAFILYKPKDIVSGDFYWYGETEGKKIIIAADCTGHGVSGAFLTIMGINFLNEVVLFNKTDSPEQILEELDRRVTGLSKDDNRIDSGMDLAIVTIDEFGELLYAGAKSPLILIRNGEAEVTSGTRRSLGYQRRRVKNKPFELHRKNLEPGDRIYLMSDGFQDQISPKAHRKFMQKRFLECLKSESEKPFRKQKEALMKKHQEWKGDLAQTDDILVMGFRV